MEKALTGRIAPAQLAEVQPFLESALRYDPSGAYGVEDFSGLQLFKCLDDRGNVVGGYALAPTIRAKKKVVWIMAAAGAEPHLDMMRSFMPAAIDQARAMGAHQVALLTTRKGLAKRLREAGFAVGGTVFQLDI